MKHVCLFGLIILMNVSSMFGAQITIGTGTGYNSWDFYPAVYGGYNRNGREQYIITATELNAAGAFMGNLNSVSFNVANPNTCIQLPDFTIKLGLTTQANFSNSTFITGLTQVFNVPSYQPVAGWNTHTFSTPFFWDGSSNLVVEVHFAWAGAEWRNASCYNTSTGSQYRSLIYCNSYENWDSSTTGWGLTTRPNMRFDLVSDIPEPATLVYPADQSLYNPQATTLHWSPVGSPTGYRLYLGTSNPPSLIGDLGTQTSYVPALEAGQTYYWQVVPYKSGGPAQNCPVWSFSTIPQNWVRIGTAADTLALPIHPYSDYSYSQSIYLQNEINVSNLRIEKLYYYWNGAAAAPNSDQLTIYMGHTSLGSFANASSWIPVSQLTQVFSGQVTLDATPGWIEIVLNNPFIYNNSSNLVVAVDENESWLDGYYCGFLDSRTPENRSLLAISTDANINPANPGTGILRAGIPNIVMMFDHIPVPPAAPILVSPCNDAVDLPEHGEALVWSENPAGDPVLSYTVYMAQNPAVLYECYVFNNITTTTFDPYTQGAVPIDNAQTWYWTVRAVNNQGSALQEVYWNFTTIPPQAGISINPVAFSDTLEIGHNAAQTLCISNHGEATLNYWISGEDTSNGPPGSAPFSSLFRHYVSSSDGPQAVVAADKDFIYCGDRTAASPNLKIHKYDMNQNYVGYFTVPGVSYLHDLAWDGQYFYGSNGSTTIYKMNFNTGTVVGTISAPMAVDGLAYNPEHNSLWFSYAYYLTEISMTGQVLQSINAEITQMRGLAYDNLSGPTPTLWVLTSYFDWPITLVQIDPNTGATLQVRDFENTGMEGVGMDSVPSGLEISDTIVPGKAALVCMANNYCFFGLELCNSIGWVSPKPRIGSVAVGASQNVTLTFAAPAAASSTGNYTGTFTIHHNAPTVVPDISISLNIWREMIPVFNISPSSNDFGTIELYNSQVCQFTITNPGDPYLVLNESDIYLSGNAEGNYILNAPGLPVSLPHNGTYSFSVTFTPVSSGVKSVTLKVQDHLNGGTLHSLAITGNCVEAMVINLKATVQEEEDVSLRWNYYNGSGGTDGWISYVVSNPTFAYGYTGMVLNAAIKYDTNILYGYAGKYLTKVSFYPRSTLASYTVRVWKGEDDTITPTTLLLSQPVTVTVNQWNVITLSTPILITGTEAIWFGYQCTVPQSDTQSYLSVGFDEGPKQHQYAMLYRFEDSPNWGELAIPCNWCIKGYIQSRGETEVPEKPSSPINPGTLAPASDELQRTLQGYNVYRNGVLLNSAPITSRSYYDSEIPAGEYSYQVKAVYNSGSSALSASAVAQILPPIPYATPFHEDWSSNSFTTQKWKRNTSNWVFNSTYGQSSPCLACGKNPHLDNYQTWLKSPYLDASSMAAVKLRFDLSLIQGSISSPNYLSVQVFDGSTWQTVTTFCNADQGGAGWGFNTYVYDISAFAANRQSRLRFLASGENSYGIEAWLLDNILVELVPASLATPTAVAALDAGSLRLTWSEVPGADWYQIYKAEDISGPFQLVATRSASLNRQLNLPLEQKCFYTVGAFSMFIPGRNSAVEIKLK